MLRTLTRTNTNETLKVWSTHIKLGTFASPHFPHQLEQVEALNPQMRSVLYFCNWRIDKFQSHFTSTRRICCLILLQLTHNKVVVKGSKPPSFGRKFEMGWTPNVTVDAEENRL
jgi:hypothetical protein